MDEAGECDRLVVMAAGRVVASGAAADIVGDTTVVTIDTDRWADAFEAVDAAGLASALVGRTLRVPDASVATVERALGDLPARVSEDPATLEERFFQLTTGARAASGAQSGGRPA
jgi:ABC-2 type transport system ATP-binding protein